MKIKYLILTLLPTISLYANHVGILKEDSNFRTFPSLKAPIQKVLKQDAQIIIYNRDYSKESGSWLNTNNGYVSTELVDINSDKIMEDNYNNKIYPHKKTIEISNALNYKLAKEIVDKLPQYDRYIHHYHQVTEDKTYYIVYVVNIENKTQRTMELEKIRKKFPSAYPISNILVEKHSIRNIKNDEYFPKFIQKQKIKKSVVPFVKKLKVEKKNTIEVLDTKPIEKEKIIINDIKIENKNKTVLKPKVEKHNKYFLGLSIGLSKLKATQYDEGAKVTLAKKPDEDAVNATVELGYNFSDTSFLMYALQMQKYNNITVYNNLISYNISSLKYPNLYAGLALGKSFIELDKSLSNTTISDQKGSALSYGIQLGYKYNISKDLALLTQYQYLKNKHETKFNFGSVNSKVIRDDNQNLTVGFRYNFY